MMEFGGHGNAYRVDFREKFPVIAVTGNRKLLAYFPKAGLIKVANPFQAAIFYFFIEPRVKAAQVTNADNPYFDFSHKPDITKWLDKSQHL